MTAIGANQTNLVAKSDILSAGVASSGSLTAEGLMMYLAGRLESVDGQINVIMAKQRATEGARQAVAGIQNILAGKESGDKLTKGDQRDIVKLLNEMGDPPLARKLAKDLGLPDECLPKGDGPLIAANVKEDGITLKERDLEKSETVLSNILSDFESSAQLDMIKLQSLMSARNSAISLATNMMSAVHKGLEAVVGNIGR